MLSGLRNASKNWLGKLVVGVLFGLLIISFAVWGIGDIFRGGVTTTAATVGSSTVSVEALRQRYQDELQQLQRRTRGAITAEQARAFGLDRQVLERMVNEATLDEQSRRAGLSLRTEDAARLVAAEPAFRGPNNSFNREAFNEYLREVGLNEAQFIEQQRRGTLRQLWIEGIAGGVTPPNALLEALHRFEREERTVRHVTVPASAIEAVQPPDAATLASYHESRKGAFRAPEYRRATLLVLQPADFAADLVLNEQDLRAAYDRTVQAGRLGRPERRRVQQLVFPSADAAATAAQRLKDGLTFEALAAELKLADSDVDLGLRTRAELADPVVAEAAFALAEGAVSAPVAGRFGSVLLRVTAIEAGTVPPFDAVRELMRAEATNARLATDRGIRDKVTTAHDRIEDLRGTGKTLAEVAAETGRQTLPLVGIDQNGRDRNGTEVVGVPDLADVVKALFQSDIGVDNEAVRTRDGGYVWFEITGIDAARDRPLEEVKAEVERGWITEETGRRLAAKTEELVKSLANGATLESIAASLGTSVVETTGVTRNGQSAIGPSAQASIFGVPLQRPVAAAAPTPGARLIAIATSSSVPPFSPTAPETAELARQLTQAKAEDSVSQYLAGLRQQLGASIDQRAVAIATGAASSQP